ncbi:MAG: hypothetical protein K8M05_12560, partial [Deltaproteobacteria bacterium]|nr:hypothetical protein [Kofleriaceae bacterium]
MTSPTELAELFGARAAAVVPDAIGAGEAARVRDRLARAGLRRYALVDRDASITCHHTYVSRRHTTAEVTRLVVRLRVRT